MRRCAARDFCLITMCAALNLKLILSLLFILPGCGPEATQLSDSAQIDSTTAFQNAAGVTMTLVPGGEFLMGSSDPEQFGEYSRSEGPRHSVRIARDFYISRHEITVGQFREFVTRKKFQTDAERSGLGCNGLDMLTGLVARRPDWIWSSPGFDQSDEHPVVCVSWADAVNFCDWLNQNSRPSPIRGRYRLPTEAEWEYCCRAGTTTLFATGDDIATLRGHANCGDLSLQARCDELQAVAPWTDGFPMTAPVGSFTPNAFGLCDLHGNVGEWCSDWFDPNYYASSPGADPRGPESPSDSADGRSDRWHVVRGGSWYNSPVSCRSAGRHDGIPTEASTTNGFRVVLERQD